MEARFENVDLKNGVNTEAYTVCFSNGELLADVRKCYDDLMLFKMNQHPHGVLVRLTQEQLDYLNAIKDKDWVEAFRKFNQWNIKDLTQNYYYEQLYYQKQLEQDEWIDASAIQDDTILNYEVLRRLEKADKQPKLWRID